MTPCSRWPMSGPRDQRRGWILSVLLGIGLGTSASAWATQVLHVGKRFVIIDAGRLHGLQKGDRVCVGPTDQPELACGLVRALRRKLAGVRLDAALTKKLETGMPVHSPAIRQDVKVKPASKQEVAKLLDALSESGGPRPESASPSPPPAQRRKPSSWRLVASLVQTPRLAYSYMTPRYDLTSEEAGGVDLWSSGSRVRSSTFGMAGQLGWNLHPDLALTLGITSHVLTKESATVAYDLTQADLAAVSRTTARDLGYWLGAHADHWFLEHFAVSGQLELGVEQVVVEATVDSRSAKSSTRLVTATARLTMPALRAGIALVWAPWSPLSLVLGTQLTKPLAGQARVSQSAHQLRDSLTTEQRGASADRFAEALALKRASLGIEVTLGLAYGIEP